MVWERIEDPGDLVFPFTVHYMVAPHSSTAWDIYWAFVRVVRSGASLSALGVGTFVRAFYRQKKCVP